MTKHHFPALSHRLASVVTLGTVPENRSIASCLLETGSYEKNELGQTLYPRYEFFQVQHQNQL